MQWVQGIIHKHNKDLLKELTKEQYAKRNKDTMQHKNKYDLTIITTVNVIMLIKIQNY